MAIKYYDLTYTYETKQGLASLSLKGTPVPSLEKLRQEIGEQIICGGTVWVMSVDGIVGIPASRIVKIEMKPVN